MVLLKLVSKVQPVTSLSQIMAFTGSDFLCLLFWYLCEQRESYSVGVPIQIESNALLMLKVKNQF